MNSFLDKSVVSSTFIGRAPQLTALENRLAQVSEGKSQVVLVAGEAGIGKSRLAAEIAQRAEQRNWQVVQGRCDEPDVVFPYAPLIDLLRTCLAHCPHNEIRELLGPLAAETVKLLPELSLLIPGLLPTPPLDPEAEKRRLFEALVQFFTRLITGPTQETTNGSDASRPLLLIIEDLHWSDETSLELLRYLARRLATQPLLLLFTYRNDEVQPTLQHFLAALSREQRPVELPLTRFTAVEVDALLRAIFEQTQPVRSEFIDALMNLTGGNPFFIEEVLKALIAGGDLFYRDGIWDRKPIDELRIPHSIQDAVQRRVAQLSEDTHRTLTVAAVAGRHFDFGLLQAVTTCSDAELLRQMKALLAIQLVIEVSADRFAFRHALTQKTIYDALLIREQQALHRAIGEVLESQAAEGTNTSMASLAYHFYAAGEWEKTLLYGRRAGEEAQALYTPRAALEQFSRALEAAQKLGETALLPVLHRARGLTNETVGDFTAARTDLETVLQLAQATGDRRAEWQALIDLGKLWASRDYDRTGRNLHAALTLARALDDPALLARNLNRLGNWHANIEENQQAVRCHQEALAIFQTLQDQRGLATTWDLLGMTRWIGTDLLAARQSYERAVDLFDALDDRQGLVMSLVGMLGCGSDVSVYTLVHASTGFAECEPYAERALTIAQEIGSRSSEVFALKFWGICLGAQGKYTPALARIQQGLAIAAEIEHHQWLTSTQRALGMLYLELLALPQAHEYLERAFDLAGEIRSVLWIRLTAGLLVRVLIQQHELAQAEAILQRVTIPDDAYGAIGLRAIWCARAELALARGEPAIALEIIDQLISTADHALVRGQGSIPYLAKLRGEILTALGDWSAAEAELQAGYGVATTQGAHPLAWRIQTALGKLYQAQGQQLQAERSFAAARTIVNEIAATLADPALRDNFVEQANALIRPEEPSTPLQAAKQAYDGLTRREREVAALIAQGKSNREIADALVVGVRTVEGHVSNILGKLGFASRTEIAVWAVEKGL